MAGSTPSEGPLGFATIAARLMAEGLIGLAPAARLFGTARNGRPRHPSTLTRYHHVGVRRPDGHIVRLECVRVGAQLMTSRDAVLRFIAAQQANHIEPTTGPPAAPTVRARRSASARSQLKAILGET